MRNSEKLRFDVNNNQYLPWVASEIDVSVGNRPLTVMAVNCKSGLLVLTADHVTAPSPSGVKVIEIDESMFCLHRKTGTDFSEDLFRICTHRKGDWSRENALLVPAGEFLLTAEDLTLDESITARVVPDHGSMVLQLKTYHKRLPGPVVELPVRDGMEVNKSYLQRAINGFSKNSELLTHCVTSPEQFLKECTYVKNITEEMQRTVAAGHKTRESLRDELIGYRLD